MRRFPIVGVGASAGGLEALTQLLGNLSSDTGFGFVLVQHLDPAHESALTHLLGRATRLPVHEVTDEMRVEPNHVFVIPPNKSLQIVRGVLKLYPREESRAPHHSIDIFLESLARDQRDLAIGVIVSGTANDGTRGLEAIKAEGGITFAQDDSAAYNSMPRSAIAAGCVDAVLSPREIAAELGRIAAHPILTEQVADSEGHPELDRAAATAHEDDNTALPSGGHGTPPVDADRARSESGSAPNPADDDFDRIMVLLHDHSGVDFSLYKSATIRRRIARRVLLNRYESVAAYAAALEGDSKELDTLYSDVLISVTSFFRDPAAFDVLQREVFPKLLQARTDDPVRVWVLGCSTGQEAYSIAMSFAEVAARAPRPRKLQVFATDLNDTLLVKARHGLYSRTLEHDLSPDRLRRFFVEEEGGYRINKEIREMVIFARQNLISDPPFSRMDMISCRNLLIYLEPNLQRKAFPVFHYALRPGGFLFLGPSESASGFANLFEPIDKKHKLFTRKSAPLSTLQLPLRADGVQRSSVATDAARRVRRAPTAEEDQLLIKDGDDWEAQRQADRFSVSRFAPPGVLVNGAMEVLQFRGATEAYLTPPSGNASFDVLKLAREGLMLPLRAALNKAMRENRIVRKERAVITANGETRHVNVEVVPLTKGRERHYLILFEEHTPAGTAAAAPLPRAVERTPRGRTDTGKNTRRVATLLAELSEMREYVQLLREQHEATTEELQASNEEVQSANEELQSINEELETSKEELESSNEELTTVNEEMAHRNVELNQLNSDLVNLQTATNLAIVLLGRDLTIRRFTPAAARQLRLLASDIGRPIGHIRHNLIFQRATSVDADGPAAFRGTGHLPPSQSGDRLTGTASEDELPGDVESFASEVVATLRPGERELRDPEGRWYALRAHPYLTLDNRVDGAVLVLVDINDRKRAELALRSEREYIEAVLRATRYPMLVLDSSLHVESANGAFYQAFNIDAAHVIGRSIQEIGNGAWNLPAVAALLDDVRAGRWRYSEIELTQTFDGVGERTTIVTASDLPNAEGPLPKILLGIHDVTERKLSEEALRQSDVHKNEFIAMLAHELRNPMAPLLNAVQLLRMGGVSAENAAVTSAMMGRQLNQMVRLVDDLLDASRIGRGKLNLRLAEIELAPAVYQAVESNRLAIEQRGLEFAVTFPSQPVFMMGDLARLTQVLGNLLNNACKFTPPGGRIDLSMTADEHHAEIRVRDSGIGIEASQLPLIFEMFMQVDNSVERSTGGLGIGLTLARDVVNMHGGSLEVHSAGLGRGTEFVVRLPIHQHAAAASTSTELEQARKLATSARRILVVDDNQDAATTLAGILRLHGREVELAHDGVGAIAIAETFRPDVLLLDIGLPGLNGYEVCRRIRSQPWGHAMKIVALTGWGQAEDVQESAQAGFDRHVVKPVSPSALFGLLADLLPASASR